MPTDPFNEPLYYTDLVHVSDKGYQRWWEKMEPVVSKALVVKALPLIENQEPPLTSGPLLRLR